MSNAQDRQNEIWQRLDMPGRIQAINEALEGTGLQYKIEPLMKPRAAPVPALDRDEVADMYGIDREDFYKMINPDEAGFHDWLHNTSEGRKYL
jgi:hypothetical protein